MIKLGLVLAILAVLSGTGAGIYTAGKRSERAAVAERDNEALREAYAELERLRAQVQELERQGIEDVSALDNETGKEIADGKTKLGAALAAVAAGKLRLRDVAASCATSNPGAGGQATAAAGAAAQAQADRRAQADGEFFIKFADERDEIARERNECVAIALKDRERQLP